MSAASMHAPACTHIPAPHMHVPMCRVPRCDPVVSPVPVTTYIMMVMHPIPSNMCPTDHPHVPCSCTNKSTARLQPQQPLCHDICHDSDASFSIQHTPNKSTHMSPAPMPTSPLHVPSSCMEPLSCAIPTN